MTDDVRKFGIARLFEKIRMNAELPLANDVFAPFFNPDKVEEITQTARLMIRGIPLESVGADKLTIVHADGRREPLTGFVLHPDDGESIADALTRTATEMNATIIFQLEVK